MLLIFWEEKLNTQLSYQKYFNTFWGEKKGKFFQEKSLEGTGSNILRCFLKRIAQVGDTRAQFQTKYMTNG